MQNPSQMGEEALGRLLEDDNLAAKNVRYFGGWMRAKEGQAKGRELAGKIRFQLMEEGHLHGRMVLSRVLQRLWSQCGL